MSVAFCHRSSGSFARHSFTTCSNAGGVSGCSSDIGFGSPLTYRSRPDGDDPNKSIFEVWLLLPYAGEFTFQARDTAMVLVTENFAG